MGVKKIVNPPVVREKREKREREQRRRDDRRTHDRNTTWNS